MIKIVPRKPTQAIRRAGTSTTSLISLGEFDPTGNSYGEYPDERTHQHPTNIPMATMTPTIIAVIGRVAPPAPSLDLSTT